MPHTHIGKFQGYEIRTNKKLSLTEIFQTALSRDLGMHHLEEYIDSEHLSYDGNEVSTVQTEFIVIDEFVLKSFYHSITRPIAENHVLGNITLISCNPLRAPPMRS